jgi:hypothetical protein
MSLFAHIPPLSLPPPGRRLCVCRAQAATRHRRAQREPHIRRVLDVVLYANRRLYCTRVSAGILTACQRGGRRVADVMSGWTCEGVRGGQTRPSRTRATHRKLLTLRGSGWGGDGGGIQESKTRYIVRARSSRPRVCVRDREREERPLAGDLAGFCFTRFSARKNRREFEE